MSSIRKRGSKWNVQIRRSGLPLLSKTFIFKTDAQRWSKATEAALDRGETPHHKTDANITLSQILLDTKDDVCSKTPREYKCFSEFEKKDFHSDSLIVINRETGEYIQASQTFRWLPKNWDMKEKYPVLDTKGMYIGSCSKYKPKLKF